MPTTELSGRTAELDGLTDDYLKRLYGGSRDLSGPIKDKLTDSFNEEGLTAFFKSYFDSNSKTFFDRVIESFGICNVDLPNKRLFIKALCNQLRYIAGVKDNKVEETVKDEYFQLEQEERKNLLQKEQKKLRQDLDNLSYPLPALNTLQKLLMDNDFAPTPFPTVIISLMDEVSASVTNVHFFTPDIAEAVAEFLKRQAAFAKFLGEFSSIVEGTDFSQISGIYLDVEADFTTPYDSATRYDTKANLQNLREAYYWSVDTIIKLEEEFSKTIK